jgi:predicted phosphohydrolase
LNKDVETKTHEDLSEKIYERELNRLKMSLSQMDPLAKTKIAMVHYPPISAELAPSRASKILKEFQIDLRIFGHLHNVDTTLSMFGKKDNIQYRLVSADYINCMPVKIL